MTDGPTILKVTRHAGIAGQVQYSVTVQYPGEEIETLSFVGSDYGGPVVMVTPAGSEIFVTDPGRHGSRLSESWVRRFFA